MLKKLKLRLAIWRTIRENRELLKRLEDDETIRYWRNND